MNFLIIYKAFSKTETILAEGTMRAKNKKSSFEAQCSFEEFLKKKHGDNFGKLTIESCKEENSLNSIFGDIFGTDNPFKF